MDIDSTRVTDDMCTLYEVDGMSCASCAARLENLLNKEEGITDATVNFASKSARIVFKPDDKITNEKIYSLAKDAGFSLMPQQSVFAHEIHYNNRISTLKKNTILAVVLALPVFIIGMFFHDSGAVGNWISMILTAPVLFVSGRQFFIAAFQNVRHKSLSMDTLVALSTGIAFVYSAIATIMPYFLIRYGIHPHVYFESAAIITAFILLGRLLEENAQHKTGEAIQKLIGLRPAVTRVLRHNAEVSIPTDALLTGDEIIVKSGERIPADGIISFGTTIIDESSLTGEPIPVEKTIGDTINTGTINTGSPIRFIAHKVGEHTILAEIIKRVKNALGSKAPIEKYVNKIAAVFVPAVIVLSILTFLFWIVLTGNFANALMATISVLVIACPCALGLATPTALIAGIGRAAEMGILIKDAAQLEIARTITHIAFDKTGTITSGKPAVIDYNYNELYKKYIGIAANLAIQSDHPLSKALTDFLKQNNLNSDIIFNTIENRTGFGMSAEYNGDHYILGNRRLLLENSVRNIPDEREMTAVYFAKNTEWLGVWYFEDTIRDNAAHTIQQMKQLGITTIMLTGDKKAAANIIAEKVGISDIYAELLPSDKADIIADYKKKNKKIAFVGDGINDAESLAIADMGFAMASGSDIAMETAGCTLMRSDISAILSAILISKATVQTIRMNLLWAFGYNIILIPIAAGILYPFTGLLLNPMIAGGAMALSSVSVVLNSLRLKTKRL